jgi:hypothetical protein
MGMISRRDFVQSLGAFALMTTPAGRPDFAFPLEAYVTHRALGQIESLGQDERRRSDRKLSPLSPVSG